MMNEATLKSMANMIRVMLPYEDHHEAQETATKALREIVDVLRENNPKMDEFLPFLNFVFKHIDADKDTGKLDMMLMSVRDIINKHYPSVEDDDPESEFVYTGFDRGQYNIPD